MVVSCSAYGCANKFKKGENISFFRFPKEPRLREKWIQALKRESWVPSSSSRICGKHFQTGKPTFDPDHPDYVPNLFISCHPAKNAVLYENRRKRLKEEALENNQQTDVLESVMESAATAESASISRTPTPETERKPCFPEWYIDWCRRDDEKERRRQKRHEEMLEIKKKTLALLEKIADK